MRREKVVFPEEVSRHVVPSSELSFTADDLAVWRRVVRRNVASLHHVDPCCVQGLEAADFHALRIPTLDDINNRVAEDGWTAVYVDGYIQAKTYAWMLANRILPIARNIRSEAQLDYSPTPDMVHDLLGHVPSLFCQELREYVSRWAEIVLEAKENPLDHDVYRANRAMSRLMSDPASTAEEIRAAQDHARCCDEAAAACPSELLHLSRIFLWSVEFGLLGSVDRYRIVGSGLISAPKERERLTRGDARLLEYSLDVIHHDVQFSDMQSYYFVSPGYDVFDKVLEEYARTMGH